VKVTCWDWDRELLTRRTLGLGCTVALGCTVGPPEVYRGPCMKITPWNSYITYTHVDVQCALTYTNVFYIANVNNIHMTGNVTVHWSFPV